MQFPQRFSDLPDYAFARLSTLLDGHSPGGPEIAMSIGEPKHDAPGFVSEEIANNIAGFAKYPPNDGSPELRAQISMWLHRRYGVQIDPQTQVVALNGTREGLFNACVALCPQRKNGKPVNVLIPNPFYQVYAVAAAAVDANPVFLNCPPETGFLPDFDALSQETLDQTAIVYLCSPSNPQGAVADKAYWSRLINLAMQHDFLIFADECYSEIYRDIAPPGILEVNHALNGDPERVVAFHSLSKRSNLPGLRSGFLAGGPKAVNKIKQLRSYAGAPLPLPLQHVAVRAWADEHHVAQSRAVYIEKYNIADRVFDGCNAYNSPKAGFFLWLRVTNGIEAALKLWVETGVKVLPGAFLSRSVTGVNPGDNYIRVALVAPTQEMQRGLQSIRDCVY